MSFFLNPTFACDYYKIGHPFMQPPGMQTVYSTWTARNNKHHKGCEKTVVFGYQYTIKEFLVDFWKNNFFNVPLDTLRAEYNDMITRSFNPTYASFEKFEALHKLGYLPIEVWGVPEGILLPTGIPDHVIFNTHPDFAWLPQYLEDVWSSNNWLPSTSATTAYYRRKLLIPYVLETCDDFSALDHMCGDFSLRGHTSLYAGAISGAAHLLNFDRTATVGANALIRDFYGTTEIQGMGTPSLEHSVVEQGVAWFKQRIVANDIPDYAKEYINKAIRDGSWEMNLIAEMGFILYLLNEVQPTGVMTYVSDTYDYWGVLDKIIPMIKEVILKRDGCFSVRPDSGNPYKIMCGDVDAAEGSIEHRGSLNTLLDIFYDQISMNETGCVELPKQIRLIYGDAITPEIIKQVGEWCIANKVSIANLCFGIGAYTYQYVTRDTRGYAIKATDCVHKDFGEMAIYKQPKTAPWKKSVRGCVAVIKENGHYTCINGLTLQEACNFPGNIMVPKLKNGELMNQETFLEIKKRMHDHEVPDVEEWLDSKREQEAKEQEKTERNGGYAF